MKLSITKLIPIDPNNLKHIELMESFEKANQTSTPIGTFRQEQKEENLNSNDISMELVLEDKSKVDDICHIQGVKDMKSCTITFMKKEKKNRKIYKLATNYALNDLGMEEVFIKIDPEDDKMLQYFESNDFECLGDEKGSIIYLKERED